MLLELALVAVVLALAGLAVYQASHRPKTAATAGVSTPAATGTTSLANEAAAASLQDSAADADLSATAESSTDELSATDTDVTNLGDSSDAF
jgi:hypothetical protein